MKMNFWLTVCFSTALIASRGYATEDQLMTLGATDAPRFTVTDKTWPAEPGEAEICLWKDDAFAAVTFTIDDNTVPDHEWWIETAKTYNFNATWFVITDPVTQNPGYSGPWSTFQILRDAGHDIESHSVTHINFEKGFDPEDPAHDIRHEYEHSLAEIQTNVTNMQVRTLAYPGGKNTIYNSDEIAAELFIAARGTVGTPNPANKINYMRVNSMSGYFYRDEAHGGREWNSFDLTTLNPAHKNYRGWYCMHFHGLKPEQETNIIDGLDYLKKKDEEIGIWIGTFADIAQYGQERDSAILTVTAVKDNEMKFTLTDTMHDDYFTFPLTVKVRVSNDWSSVAAAQAGALINTKLIEHEGNQYALVQAVPDRGEVRLVAR